MNDTGYTARYLAEVEEIARTIDAAAVERMVLLCCDVRDRGGRIFFVGSGGGAANASHAAAG